MVDVDVHVLSHFKEELARAVDKWLRVICICYLKAVRVATKKLKDKAVLNLKQYCTCICCYVALSNYFEIVSTVTFILSRTRLL